MVRDKLCFSWTRWMSYGLCFREEWMWNHNWGVYEENQILKMLWKWSWRNVTTYMDVKVEVLSSPMKNSKINIEVCHGKFQVQHIFKRPDGNAYRTQLITLNSKKRTSLQYFREIGYWLRMEQTYSKSRRMIVILL